MVEFGLKLEDNKVDEWSGQYIDYETLKELLKRAEASAAHRDEILERMPPGVAAEMMMMVRESNDWASSNLRERNDASYREVVAVPISSSSSSSAEEEATPLLSGAGRRWSSSPVFQVTSYLGLANNDDQASFPKALADADKKFDACERTSWR
jgi:hypothetical protein